MGHRLKQKGYQNIAVYEAKSRVGGRVHTVYVKNNDGTYSMAELGGHSITDGFYANGKLYDSKELLRTSGFTQEKLSEILQTLPPSACSMADVIDYVFAENPLLKRVFTYHVGSYEDGVWGKSLNKNLKHYYPSITEMVEANYGKQQDLQSEPVTVSEELYSRYDKPIVKSWAEDPYAQGSYSAVGTMLGRLTYVCL
eukprot:gene13252-13360_t